MIDYIEVKAWAYENGATISGKVASTNWAVYTDTDNDQYLWISAGSGQIELRELSSDFWGDVEDLLLASFDWIDREAALVALRLFDTK